MDTEEKGCKASFLAGCGPSDPRIGVCPEVEVALFLRLLQSMASCAMASVDIGSGEFSILPLSS